MEHLTEETAGESPSHNTSLRTEHKDEDLRVGLENCLVVTFEEEVSWR